MCIFFVDLGVVVYVDTERVIWDFDTKIREKSWSWNKKSCLGLGLENYGALGLEIQSLGLDSKVLFTSLYTTQKSMYYCQVWILIFARKCIAMRLKFRGTLLSYWQLHCKFAAKCANKRILTTVDI